MTQWVELTAKVPLLRFLPNFLRSNNPSKMDGETRSSQAPTAPTTRRFYLAELAVPLGYIFVTFHPFTNVANVLPSAGRH